MEKPKYTETGRLTSTEPKFRNVDTVRKIYDPDKVTFTLNADYSAIELKIMRKYGLWPK